MANINDIAKELGLSATTISRVLSGKAEQYRIGKATQQKVKELAEKLNYIPNEFASNLRLGKSNTIALSIPSVSNPFFARIVSDLNKELRSMDFTTIFTESDENEAIETKALRKLKSRNIEGLIIAPCSTNSGEIQNLHQQGLPIVCVDRYFENMEIPFVATDNFAGGYLATSHLLKNGHRNIACIQGNPLAMPNIRRVEGYCRAMKEANSKEIYIEGESFDEQNGYIETKLLLQAKQNISAIFTLSNTIAMGCLKALKEEGIKVPDDVSLITFDDAPYLDLLSTPLSSIAQPVSEISKIAIKLLQAKLNKKTLKHTQVLLKPKIIVRDSVRSV